MRGKHLLPAVIIPMAFFGLLRPAAAHAISPGEVTAQVATFIGNNLLTRAVAESDTLNWSVKNVFTLKTEFKKKVEVDGEATFHEKTFLDKLGKVKTLRVFGDSTIGNDSADEVFVEGKIKRTLGKVYIKDGLRVTGELELDTESIDSDEIANETILSRDVADGKILAKDIKDGTITADKLASAFELPVTNVLTVSPGPTNTDSGNNLEATVGFISGASANNQYVVFIEPGVYDLGIGSLDMPDYVHLVGSGEGVTTILSDVDDGSSATVNLGDGVQIRHLTIKNISEATTGIRGVLNDSTGVFMEYVTIFSDGTNTTLSNYGFLNDASSEAVLSHVTVQVTDPTNFGIGIFNNALATLTCYACDVEISTDGTNKGVDVGGGTVNIYDSRITVQDGGARAGSVSTGVEVTGGTLSIFNSYIEASGAEDADDGLYIASGTPTVSVERSTFKGDDNAILIDAASSTLNVATSRVENGLLNSAGGTVTCVGAYDGSFAAVNTACQ